MNRREFLSAMSVAAAAGAFGPAGLARPAKVTSLSFLRGERLFPLLFVGEGIETSERIRQIVFFEPFFGSQRSVVNPVLPLVGRKRLQFMLPGEYYLYVNGSPLKVVVFSREDSINTAVLRVFDFAVANNIYFQAHDELWYSGRRKYLERFFLSDQPMILSCGPTHQMFRMLIAERFGLPTRVTSANSAYFQRDSVLRIAHNIPEIYMPDLGKFVACDLPGGFIPQWLDALELSVKSRQWGAQESETERIEDLGVPIHSSVDTQGVSSAAFRLLERAGDDGRSISATRDLLGSQKMNSGSRANAARAWYSGTGYWGRLAHFAKPHGNEFLDGYQQFALLETDATLAAIVLKDLAVAKATLVELDELRERLACGAQEAVDLREWDSRFIADDERRGPFSPMKIELF